LPSYWKAHSLADIQIITLALLATLPQLIIAGLDAPAAVRERMQASVARGILSMIGGHQPGVRTAGTARDHATAGTQALRDRREARGPEAHPGRPRPSTVRALHRGVSPARAVGARRVGRSRARARAPARAHRQRTVAASRALPCGLIERGVRAVVMLG